MKKRTNMTIAEDLEKRQANFNGAVSRVVKHWMNARGVRQTDLARLLGVARPTITHLLRGYISTVGGGKRPAHWSIANLLAISEAMGATFPDFIATVCRVVEGGQPRLALSLAGLEPNSKERLECIVREAALIDAENEDEENENRCIIDMNDLPWVCQGFVSAYLSGKLSDDVAGRIIFGATEAESDSESVYRHINEAYARFAGLVPKSEI